MTTRHAMPARFRMAAVAALAVCALALAGCQGGSAPDATTTTTASATPSATPTPTPTAAYRPADATGKAQNVPVPVKPALADENSKAGLEAFVGYWYQTLAYSYETGDTTPVASLSGPNCVFCRGLRDGVDLAWKDGRWISGGQIQTASVTAIFTPGASSQQATIQTSQQPILIHKADGSLYQDPSKGSNTASQAVASFGPSGWVFDDLGLIR